MVTERTLRDTLAVLKLYSKGLLSTSQVEQLREGISEAHAYTELSTPVEAPAMPDPSDNPAKWHADALASGELREKDL